MRRSVAVSAILAASFLGVCQCFSHIPFALSLARRKHMVCLSARQSCSMGLRMSGGQDERKEDGLVEISREELRALAEKAGIRIQIGNTPLNNLPAGQSREEGRIVFEPFLNAIEPIRRLPPILQYPIFLALFGVLSLGFLPLFGETISVNARELFRSATLGDLAGTKTSSQSEKAAIVQEAASQSPTSVRIQKTDVTNEKKNSGFYMKASAPPPEELKTTSAEIGQSVHLKQCYRRGILKNLDQYVKPNPKVQQMRAESDARRAAAEAANSARRAAEAK